MCTSIVFNGNKTIIGWNLDNPIYSMPGVTYQAQNSDKDGNVLQIVAGQGYRYIKKPRYSVMTNFQTLHEETQHHPWAGVDRYQTACQMLDVASDDFDYHDCFKILENVAQSIDACPTQVSMVFDVTENIVYWCENKQWDNLSKKSIHL